MQSIFFQGLKYSRLARCKKKKKILFPNQDFPCSRLRKAFAWEWQLATITDSLQTSNLKIRLVFVKTACRKKGGEFLPAWGVNYHTLNTFMFPSYINIIQESSENFLEVNRGGCPR